MRALKRRSFFTTLLSSHSTIMTSQPVRTGAASMRGTWCARRNGPLWSHRPLRQTATTGATGRTNQAPAVTTHVLTAYHLRSALEDKLPPIKVTPLSLTDDDGKECVQALWSAVRLLRERRVSNVSSLVNPFDEDGNSRVELFAQAGARDVGEVLRCGKAILSTRELAVKALGYQSTREVVEKAEFDLTSSSADHESRLAYAEILREVLYMHALGSTSELFDVSRDGRTSILLTAKLVAGSWAATRVSDAVVVLDQYTLSVDVTSEKDAELKCSLGHELRSPLTVRQILDDPALMDLPEGSEVVALGGPHLQGQLSYTKIGDKKIGDAREELKGESLLSYHRKRYEARVPLLENARDDDDAVQLVQPGRPPTPYPAELLSPVIKMNILDSDTRDAVSDACSGSPGDLQRRVSGIRAMLGQPFSPLLHLDEKMRRLTAAMPALPNNLAQTRVGDLTKGPAAMDFNDSTSESSSSSQLVLMLGKSSSVQPEKVGQYLERLADGASAVMTEWGSATDEQIRRVKSDIQDASVVFYDDSSFDVARQSIFKFFRPGNKDQRPRVVLFPLSADRAFVEASVRRVSSQIPSVSARWAADPSSYARFCVALVASQYGAQATTCKEAIAPELTRFIGAGVKSGLPVVDEKGRIIAQQNGAPVGASLATAVHNAIDLGLKRIIIHHAGRSDDSDIATALALADSNGIDILAVVDILEHDFGRVLGWSKDAGRVVQPERGFWAILDEDDEAILVTTGMDSNLASAGVTRPLRLSKRFGILPLSDCVAQAYRLAEVDRYYAKTSFRMPVTLRHVNDGGVDKCEATYKTDRLMQQQPKKISLRVELSSTPSHTLGRGGDEDGDEDEDEDEQRRRNGGANRRTRTIDSLSERDVMSMSLGEESGGGATDDATFMSPPPVSSDSRSTARRRSGVMATTPSMMVTTPTSQKASTSPDLDPMSVERQSGCGSPRLYYGGASKRPRHSNDWVEDEVHPCKVFFGSVMASSMAKAFVCNTTISSPEGDQIQCATTTGDSSWSFGGGGGAAPLQHPQSDLPSLLRRTLSGTYDDRHNQQYESGGTMGGGSGDAATASRGASSAIGIPGATVMTATNGVVSHDDFASAAAYYQQNGGGLPSSSPSDPSPLLDLRKAALMRSSSQNRRFANPSKNVAATGENVAISAKGNATAGLPPRWRAQCPGMSPPTTSEGGICSAEPKRGHDRHGGASPPKEGSSL